MKKVLSIIVALVVLLAALAGGLLWYHKKEMNKLEQQITEEQAQKALMDQRIAEITGDLETAESDKQTLLDRIDELIAEEVVVFDAATVQEEIQEIGEMATVEYHYTNASTLDSSKKFWFTNWNLPLTTKTAVITMDGVLKAGVEIKSIEITSDEISKTITVKIPEAKILSNELDEDSLQVYDEKSGLFNELTLSDSSELRTELKTEAEEKALQNGLLEQAETNAKTIIRSIIEATPSIKENYTIVFK